jgi:hypothetical protein
MNPSLKSWATLAVGLALVVGGLSFALRGAPATDVVITADPSLPTVTVWKSPTCGCCAGWVDHLRESGFAVEVVNVENLAPIKAEHGVGTSLQSCHTARVDGYTIEGHVPAEDIRRLLERRPAVAGLAVPGMPIGSPGMEAGDVRERYDVLTFDRAGATTVWATHN